MQRIIATNIVTLALLSSSLGIGLGQGTIRVTFDNVPALPPGSTGFSDYYPESGVGAHALGGYFTMRWSGDPLFPDNGTAYVQPRGSTDLFFNYGGSSWRFNAVSVDLALYSAASLDPVTVQFVASGYNRGSDVIATTAFTVTGAVDSQGRPAFQTFYFPPEFQGMYYLSISPTAPLCPHPLGLQGWLRPLLRGGCAAVLPGAQGGGGRWPGAGLFRAHGLLWGLFPQL